MAYQVKRKKQHVIKHSFELLSENDEVIETLEVDLAVEKCAKVFRERQIRLMRAQQELKTKPDDVDVLTEIGESIIALYEVVFGEMQTQILLKFYNDEHVEMLSDVMPFIQEVIVPAMYEKVQEYRKDLAANVNLNRKQKRKFGKM